MILVRLNGGLGNQLFQYAAGYALAKKNNVELKIDLSSYSENRSRLPEILKLSISAKIADIDEVRRYRNPYGIISKVKRFISQKIYKKYYVDWEPSVLNKSGNIYLDGYFQSDLYFSHCTQDLVREFQISQQRLDNISDTISLIHGLPNCVSIHVRRGDYVTDHRTKFLHDICGNSYFGEAVAKIESILESCNFLVFSDDIDWVMKNMDLPQSTHYISGRTRYDGNVLDSVDELYLMSICKHHIISNSTFSWWGAYLNSSAEKRVIYPSLWNRSSSFKHRYIIPTTWNSHKIITY
ncbi:alpha-1,2-fucosyltransferase [Polynucleobacter sp. MWH-CaK5]|uniref:alpha-1,2-fucosyltransferase n=1 Tax=Polynucleobacter sp. MWH-CaK5 TaxID=2689107 RepID=UPI001BFCFB31|nr:alpha-1,2-fucosyltransferase [Polynucleobacter sp. MWH-CaK5]QWD89167.1 alpha-1,2-fucosyltransferase [Polynucleobacter sp. MWH-CaK5]